MQQLDFVKAHGLGNDFIIVDCMHDELGDADLPALSIRLCDRHFGIGADGLVRILPSQSADYRMQIINSDGSEAEMCGNAIRCFANYLVTRGLAGDKMTVETPSGVKAIAVGRDGGQLGFRVNVGAPGLEPEAIPVLGYNGPVISQPLEVGGKRFNITCVSVGNPHCVIFLDSVDDIPVEHLGREIETHPAFPKKTNVEFAQALSRGKVKVRVWERGAGLTLACGTGACATVVAGNLNGLLDRTAAVQLPGGELHIEWAEGGDLYMTGPAQEVFTGTIKADSG